MNKIKFIAVIVVAAVVSYALYINFTSESNHSNHAHGNHSMSEGSEGSGSEGSGSASKANLKQDEIAFWTCSMHPSVKSQDPGLCPICNMDLAPVSKVEAESGVIFIDTQKRQLIGVKTGKVIEDDFQFTVNTLGRVVHDERKIVNVNLKVSGWIGELFANYDGIHVKKGEPLFTLYSPDLYVAQTELIKAIELAPKPTNDQKQIIEASRNKLRLYGLLDEQILKIEKNKEAQKYIPILSPAHGAVMHKKIDEGSKVNAGELLFKIVDHSVVWVVADIYESDIPLVREGMTASITFPHFHEKTFEEPITYVPPHMETGSRTNSIRIDLPNLEQAIKPGMQADVGIKLNLGKKLLVPRSAVIFSGKHHVVFVDLGEDKMMPKMIKIGKGNEDYYVVTEGLKVDDTVITSANFLIASESRLKSAVKKW